MFVSICLLADGVVDNHAGSVGCIMFVYTLPVTEAKNMQSCTDLKTTLGGMLCLNSIGVTENVAAINRAAQLCTICTLRSRTAKQCFTVKKSKGGLPGKRGWR